MGIEWYPTKAEGLEHFASAVKTKSDRDVFLDELDVPTTGRNAVCAVLNQCQNERSSWSGKVIKSHTGLSPDRSTKTKPATETSALENLL